MFQYLDQVHDLFCRVYILVGTDYFAADGNIIISPWYVFLTGEVSALYLGQQDIFSLRDLDDSVSVKKRIVLTFVFNLELYVMPDRTSIQTFLLQ